MFVGFRVPLAPPPLPPGPDGPVNWSIWVSLFVDFPKPGSPKPQVFKEQGWRNSRRDNNIFIYLLYINIYIYMYIFSIIHYSVHVFNSMFMFGYMLLSNSMFVFGNRFVFNRSGKSANSKRWRIVSHEGFEGPVRMTGSHDQWFCACDCVLLVFICLLAIISKYIYIYIYI